MSWTLIIIVLIVGLALVALEIVALPGGISGICGGVAAVVAIWQTYATYGATAGTITLAASVVVCIAMLVFLMKSGTWKYFSLNEKSDGRTMQVDGGNVAVGARGVTVSRLAPAGKASFGGDLVEVHSTGAFIDENTPVEITDIDGYRITVKPLSN